MKKISLTLTLVLVQKAAVSSKDVAQHGNHNDQRWQNVPNANAKPVQK